MRSSIQAWSVGGAGRRSKTLIEEKGDGLRTIADGGMGIDHQPFRQPARLQRPVPQHLAGDQALKPLSGQEKHRPGGVFGRHVLEIGAIAGKQPSSPDGRARKIEFGAWMMPAFKLLAHLKRLRGTAFDIFGYTLERRMERKFIADYEQAMHALLANLSAESLVHAVEVASRPEGLRGFGHVKLANAEKLGLAELALRPSRSRSWLAALRRRPQPNDASSSSIRRPT